MSRPIAGVMGPGEGACLLDLEAAFRLGQLLAEDGWVILSGGRDAGIMREVNRGAKTVPGIRTVNTKLLTRTRKNVTRIEANRTGC